MLFDLSIAGVPIARLTEQRPDTLLKNILFADHEQMLGQLLNKSDTQVVSARNIKEGCMHSTRAFTLPHSVCVLTAPAAHMCRTSWRRRGREILY